MALATRGTVDPVRKFLSRASYSENLGGFRAALFWDGDSHCSSLSARRCRSQNDLLTAWYPSAGQCWGRWLPERQPAALGKHSRRFKHRTRLPTSTTRVIEV